jgi:membrane-associated phospholipid phosphatase
MINDFFDMLWSTEWIQAIQQFFGTEWRWFFAAVTLLGGHEVIAIVIALALWLSGRQLAYALLGIVLLTLVTDMLLWQVVNVPRPSGPELYIYTEAPVSSFPSGHTVVATTAWGLLAVFGRIPKLAAVVMVIVVMLSRLYLGMHYVGDVLGGALVGLVLLTIYVRLWPSVTRWSAHRSFRFFMILGLGIALATLPFTLVTARAWLAFGGALGIAVGLPLEYRYVRYTPGSPPLHRQALKVLLGLGIAGVLLVGRSWLGWSTPIVGAAVFAVVALWLALGAPLLFTWLGLARHQTALYEP